MNPLTCYDTVAKASWHTVFGVNWTCPSWMFLRVLARRKRPICVTDVAERASPASPANKRSSTKTQYACCPQPRTT
ncbi:unnamed protein product [Durusdinium trenchii]|uniref:Uncharacterized protein n=1 Tax=Durusdinium trenchii TaxID=1381693 RepID=A0ABP0HUD0_9DINO